MEIDKNLDLLNINNTDNFQMDGGSRDSKVVISKLKKLLQTNRIKYLRKFNNKLIYELSNSKLNNKTTLIISTKLMSNKLSRARNHSNDVVKALSRVKGIQLQSNLVDMNVNTQDLITLSRTNSSLKRHTKLKRVISSMDNGDKLNIQLSNDTNIMPMTEALEKIIQTEDVEQLKSLFQQVNHHIVKIQSTYKNFKHNNYFPHKLSVIYDNKKLVLKHQNNTNTIPASHPKVIITSEELGKATINKSNEMSGGAKSTSSMWDIYSYYNSFVNLYPTGIFNSFAYGTGITNYLNYIVPVDYRTTSNYIYDFYMPANLTYTTNTGIYR